MKSLEPYGIAELAKKLATEASFKRESSGRRVRGLMGGKWVFDSLDVEYVWEHQYPVYYIPYSAIEEGPAEVSITDRSDKGYGIGTLSVGESSADIAVFTEGPLKGLVRISMDGIDAWYAEDEKLSGPYPKDPYKRIECLSSSREIRVEIDGIILACGTNTIFLHETKRQTRYYLSPATIKDWSTLVPSSTSTFCPYKGQASYYHLRIGNKEIKDVAWCYEFPVPESAQIQNRLCFDDEKVDVFVDGKPTENTSRRA